MFGDWIRRTGFWALDALKGAPIRKNYIDVKKRNTVCDLNVEQLKKLLEHATSTTQFYSSYDGKEISCFPVITKNIIKAKWNELYSFKYKNAHVHHMPTSGSTGTPFVMDWDMRKRKRQLAEVIYYNELGGQLLGNPYVYFRVWTEKNRKSKLELWKQNLVPINILYLDDENLEKIRQRLQRKPYINSCLAYASTYEYLIKYMRSKNDTPDLYHTKTLFTSSEVLSLEMKQQIIDTMGCQILDRYSNEENGFLAQTGDNSDLFNVNIASFYIEVLKLTSDEPAAIGELGRIVVTDLYGFAVPLIRYDTGDLAIKAEEKDGWTTKLKTIQGRQVDVIYDTSGKRLTAHTWSVYMWKFDKLKQYQFIQKSAKEYVLKVNGADGIYTDEEFTKHLKSILGVDAIIRIEHVSGIPALASGKFKKTVCNYEYNSNDYR